MHRRDSPPLLHGIPGSSKSHVLPRAQWFWIIQGLESLESLYDMFSQCEMHSYNYNNGIPPSYSQFEKLVGY